MPKGRRGTIKVDSRPGSTRASSPTVNIATSHALAGVYHYSCQTCAAQLMEQVGETTEEMTWWCKECGTLLRVRFVPWHQPDRHRWEKPLRYQDAPSRPLETE